MRCMSPTPKAPIERIKRLSRREDRGYLTPCRIFTGKLDTQGYARIYTGGRPKSRRVHAIVYEHVYGPAMPGYELHHRCEQRDCHEPLHIVELTPGQHGATRRRTHCRQGHALSGANLHTYTRADGYVTRICRTCNRDDTRRRYHARKDGA